MVVRHASPLPFPPGMLGNGRPAAESAVSAAGSALQHRGIPRSPHAHSTPREEVPGLRLPCTCAHVDCRLELPCTITLPDGRDSSKNCHTTNFLSKRRDCARAAARDWRAIQVQEMPAFLETSSLWSPKSGSRRGAFPAARFPGRKEAYESLRHVRRAAAWPAIQNGSESNTDDCKIPKKRSGKKETGEEAGGS